MLICCLPFRADYYIREKNWIYGDVPCRLKVLFISLNRAGSIMFLTAMAINRYFKVVHPHHRVNTTSTKCAVKVAGSLWILAVAVCSHLLAEPRSFEHDNRTYCEPFDMSNPLRPTAIWTDIVFILFKFAIPAPIILFSTSCIIWKLNQIKIELRSKYKRAMKLVIAVAAVFVICFLPTNIAVIAVLIAKLRGAEGCKSYETAVHVFYNTLFMTYLNSVLDPVIYYFSKEMHRYLIKLTKAFQSKKPIKYQRRKKKELQRLKILILVTVLFKEKVAGWGVEMALDQISDLVYDIKKLANPTTHALKLVSKELQEPWMMTLRIG
ncbi:hydroxycarboxylic acid receptor 3-like [Hemiscyllium ocellatum]|uniref:hydroxycarboxylic acid receptor 3-like n=1 Tax=Hemiscyllium ocellatum TaxID=170820 RepID=UPI002966CCAF|nr:hydroxycarboxylic acid receptor 3-like [Hemiscyllium ocellatum]